MDIVLPPPNSLESSSKTRTFTTLAADPDAIKLSVATSTSPQSYSGGALDGAQGASSIRPVGKKITITTTGPVQTAISQVWQVDASVPTFVDETVDANDAGTADFLPFPATDDVGDYVAIGYTSKFNKLEFDNAGGTAGIGGVVVWEYWNGSAWAALSGVTDGTTNFTAAAGDAKLVTWTAPVGWAASVINGSASLFYVRARITTVYSTNPVLDQAFIWPSAYVTSSPIVVNGLDVDGKATSDSISLTLEDGSQTVTGTKNFSSVTSIDVPAQAATTGTFVFGVVGGCSIPFCRQIRVGGAGNLELLLHDGVVDTIPDLGVGERLDVNVSGIGSNTTATKITILF